VSKNALSSSNETFGPKAKQLSPRNSGNLMPFGADPSLGENPNKIEPLVSD